jgi:hypothetical protein
MRLLQRFQRSIAPVLTNHAEQARRIGLEAGDVVANLERNQSKRGLE